MPYTFIDIEKRKTGVIKAIFLFLVLFYFIVADILWLITAQYFSIPVIRLNLGFKLPEASVTSIEETVIVLLAALIIAWIHWCLSTSDIIKKVLGVLNAVEPDPKDSYHSILKNVVEEVSVATGGHKISPFVIPVAGLNAFAISDCKGNAAIGVTEGLLAKLTRSQLESVIAHEAAHVVSGDNLVTSVSCSLFAIYSAIFEELGQVLRGSSRAKGGSRSGGQILLYLYLIYIVLSITQFINLLLNMFMSRQREHRADAVAVKLTRNPISLAEALYVISKGWKGIGSIPKSLSPIFITNPDYSELEESEGFISDLFSTHPPTEKRLETLLSMAHSDTKALEMAEKTKSRIPLEQGALEIKNEPARDWLVYKDNTWKGPFPLNELIGLGLSPATWVSKLGEGNVKRASEDATLSEMLKTNIPGQPGAGNGVCPECGQPLSEILYEGAPAFRCHYCEGVLVGYRIIPRILLREDVEIPEGAKKLASLAMITYSKGIIENTKLKVAYRSRCPKCGNKMRHSFYSSAYPVESDICDSCGNIWFGKYGLEALQYLSEKSRHENI